MKETEVCERAFSKPLACPAYPSGPYRFRVRVFNYCLSHPLGKASRVCGAAHGSDCLLLIGLSVEFAVSY
jgi:hypothetical protein